MTDPSSPYTLGGAGVALLAALAGLWRWLFRRQVERIDDHESRVQLLERTTLGKDDLTQMETRLSRTITQGHEAIQREIGQVRQTADKAHERIDGIRDKP